MLQNKVCIVTGAASGIGLVIAKYLAIDGANVVMCDINEKQLKIESEEINAIYFQADLIKREHCKALIDFSIDKFKKVDILVNVAGIQSIAPIEKFSEDQWDSMISLMLTAPFLLTKYVWPSMKKQKWGRVININSIQGLVASKFKSAYVAAKHGLGGLTKAAALEGGEYGITVNSICPAYVKTPLVENQIDEQARYHGISREDVIKDIMLKNAVIKELIEPSSIAEVVKFLCSDVSSHITGSMLTIDGGWTAN